MKQQKRRDPIKVVLVLTVCLAVLAAACMFAGNAITSYRQTILAQRQDEVEAINAERDQEYAKALAEFEAASQSGANLAWPPQKTEGWDVVDLTNYPLESPATVTLTRAEVMNNGMLLVNEWHSRPDDFSEANLVSVGSYTDGKIQVSNYSLKLFPVVIDALQAALTDAAAQGYQNYMVDEAYRSYEDQNALFNKYMEQYASRYSGDALIARTKRDVNYPGTSEFNSGLGFTMRLYKRGDAAVNGSDYVTTPEGQWMNENCWKYGLIFRFPKTDYPVKGQADKSYKTGVGVSLRAYRYVGKGNAAVMHTLGLCLEEYIEYLQEHPHIAVFEDGALRYEIVRQYVGDSAAFQVQLTGKAKSYTASLDNMDCVITVFEY
ncbi:MAG: D-alanyl-D-alanine carboxypeptidase family protein [Clostridia bacterium]|nr:D-alanyl-D-alanine carboxypeptidase family protein [Clostridia bacterium]